MDPYYTSSALNRVHYTLYVAHWHREEEVGGLLFELESYISYFIRAK